MPYKIHRGAGKNVTFWGLHARFFYLLCIGVIISFIVLVVVFISGANLMMVMLGLLTWISVLVFVLVKLSDRFGAHGLEKWRAAKKRPAVIVCRKRVRDIVGKTNV